MALDFLKCTTDYFNSRHIELHERTQAQAQGSLLEEGDVAVPRPLSLPISEGYHLRLAGGSAANKVLQPTTIKALSDKLASFAPDKLEAFCGFAKLVKSKFGIDNCELRNFTHAQVAKELRQQHLKLNRDFRVAKMSFVPIKDVVFRINSIIGRKCKSKSTKQRILRGNRLQDVQLIPIDSTVHNAQNMQVGHVVRHDYVETTEEDLKIMRGAYLEMVTMIKTDIINCTNFLQQEALNSTAGADASASDLELNLESSRLVTVCIKELLEAVTDAKGSSHTAVYVICGSLILALLVRLLLLFLV